ncbi:MAG TPA: DUF92 domain-containing protein [Candidatus Thermoplasmatota archaeon]|nr:DUF92 domain-containing protein [Candidatus Thermoplasmatota archaeon]
MSLPEIGSLAFALTLAQVAVVGAIGVYTYRKDMLNAMGAFTAFAMGATIVVFTNVLWLFLLFSLLGLASVATRFHFKEKEKRKVAEKGGGRRATRNVVANGLTPTVIALLTPAIVSQWGVGPAAIAYVSAVSVAASDTLASEFGSLAKRVYMITTFKRVPPGVDGGVSAIGQTAALAGAFIMALIGAVMVAVVPLAAGALAPFPPAAPLTVWLVLIPTLVGFIGCQVDSVLGATLEVDGLLNKEEVNLLSITAGAGLGFALALLV